MMTGIEGFAWIVKPKIHLKFATARFDAAADAVGLAPGVPVGVHAAIARAPADNRASRRVSDRMPPPLPARVRPAPYALTDAVFDATSGLLGTRRRLALRALVFRCGMIAVASDTMESLAHDR
jgi:hypothetical protein